MDRPLTDDMIETIKNATGRLTGFKRRQFMTDTALKYCNRSPHRAETVFGWGREVLNTRLNEKQTGIRCLENFRVRGRKRTEERMPELAEEIRRIVEPQAQADPKFQTAVAFTRIAARAARNE